MTPIDDVLCPVHGDSVVDPRGSGAASASCPACAQLAASLGELQTLARELPVHVPQALDRDVMRARLVAAPPTLATPPRDRRRSPMAALRLGLGLALCAGAAAAAIGLFARPHAVPPRASMEPSREPSAPAPAAVDPAPPANAAALDGVQPAPEPRHETAKASAATSRPRAGARKKSSALVRRDGAKVDGHDGTARVNPGVQAPSIEYADAPPVIGAVESGAPASSPSPQPTANGPTAPSPESATATANPTMRVETARDERPAPGAAVNGGGQTTAGSQAGATSTVRAAIVSTPPGPGGVAPGQNPASPGSTSPTDVPRTAQAGEGNPRHDERALERAQRRQEMRQHRREERIHRAERRR